MQWKLYPDFCIENIENIQIFEKSTFKEKFTPTVLVPSFEKNHFAIRKFDFLVEF